ncbi:MAG TPA: transglutaminase family protein [Kofleriaceae bacterium]|nr:transglutaminase family protein [Kofleriaceae bacterium]
MSDRATDLDGALEAHDELLARRGVEVWLGAEPTFTRAESLAPAWLNAAEGDDKLDRAEALARALAAHLPGAEVARVAGRRFPDEPAPRFAIAVRWHEARSRYLTVTPDPGVVEVNAAPCANARELAVQVRAIYEAARAAGLSPVRRRFHGELSDSGGGGQLTLGGPTPEASPFLRYPHVLPALVRYFNNHPALSYWFAGECVGSASQGPRPDEGARERWDELAVALAWAEQLADRGELSPERLQQALAPLLVDVSGNSHRAELNVEKLWNADLPTHGPRHGKMGVIELRAIRMPERPSMLYALAVLVRSIVARLAVAHYREPLVDWHDELHDRFALPAALARDLRLVLGDLDDHGLGVPAALRRELEAWRPEGIVCRLGDATLALRPALEFWPLFGDTASQERAGARWVDASTERWELAIDGSGPERVAIAGKWAQLRALGESSRVLGVRRRRFDPWPGLHPGMPALDPLVIEWAWAGRAQRIELYAWRPGGGVYADLPADDAAALARRAERVRIATRDGEVEASGYWLEARPFTIDLRGSELPPSRP